MKKIMFNDRYGLTEAVLSGRKTQTRRILPAGTPLGSWRETERKSKYKASEIVAVAQSYKDCGNYHIPKENAGWTNKMFIRAGLMPYHIRITNVRIERLQDISDEDCIKEGIYKGQCGSADTHFMDAYYFKGDKQPYCTPREAYAALIDRISGNGTWNSNPYVFVYDFELIK